MEQHVLRKCIMKKQLAALALFVTMISATEVSACYGHNCGGFGAAFGGAIVGGMVGALITPQPQPSVVIVMPTPIYVPTPVYVPTPIQNPEHAYFWWCSSSKQWYPDVRNCSVDWSHR